MTPRIIGEDTREAQARASRPDASAWVSANAGSGKTHVLTQRVIRLLLAGVPASRILCLTFTKAAAANMALRIFDTLSKWTSFDDDQLRMAIISTGATFRPESLLEARRLFSRTIETPGGLKIQTIHGFCESVLQRFPFEANVPAGFEIVDDERRKALLERAKSETLKSSADDAELARALGFLAGQISAEQFDDLVDEALSKTDIVDPMVGRRNGLFDYRARLAEVLTIEAKTTRSDIERTILEDGITASEIQRAADALDAGGINDKKLGELFRRLTSDPMQNRIGILIDIFFTAKGDRRGAGASKLVSKAVQARDPELLPRLEREGDRIQRHLETLKSVDTIDRGNALFHLIGRILKRYTNLKNAASLLDFDDLIQRTSILLLRSSALWVRYKLDSGIDHIMVDEAQDTSRRQWDILEALASEFTSGAGQSLVPRTFFAVGDEKQSIFSFQGADPRLFALARRAFLRRSVESQGAFFDVALNLSFRSARGILHVVDTVFADEGHRRGLSFENIQPVHQAWKSELPGLVELWAPVGPRPDDDKPDWRLPLDAVDRAQPAAILSDRIAELITGLLDPLGEHFVHDESSRAPRRISPGDIMILMRRRGHLFETLIRTLKRKGLPVAGADRMILKNHIAVMDLLAIGRFCLLPEDDLTLACVLKSPLIGFDDDDLLRLAPNRGGSLFHALSQSPDERDLRVLDILTGWRAAARAQTPFFFYSDLLESGGGRLRFLARLGPEAGDAVDEFLRLALTRERMETPSLAGFVAYVQTGDVEVKRDMEAAASSIRVMTVHAAKGLEAKIVILPDTCQIPSDRFDPKLFKLDTSNGDAILAWSPKKDLDCPMVAEARTRGRAERLNEYRRLLYVAMTRAEERLYVMGAHGAHGPPEDSWYRMIERSLAPLLTSEPSFWSGDESVRRFRDGDWSERQHDGSRVTAAQTPATTSIPAWLNKPVPTDARRAAPVRPSHSDQSADMEAADPTGLAFGDALHRLLQALPRVSPDRWSAVTREMLDSREFTLEPIMRDHLVRQAIATLEHPDLASLFGEGSLSEVPISATIEIGSGAKVEIAGRIDRLVQRDDEILFADFKTGAAGDENRPPRAYLRQLALYAAALREMFPGKSIRALLVWTSGPRIEEIPWTELSAAYPTLEAS